MLNVWRHLCVWVHIDTGIQTPWESSSITLSLIVSYLSPEITDLASLARLFLTAPARPPAHWLRLLCWDCRCATVSLWHSDAGDLNCSPPPCTTSSLPAEPSLQHLRCSLSADAGDACKLSRLAPPALSSMSAVFAFMVSVLWICGFSVLQELLSASCLPKEILLLAVAGPRTCHGAVCF